MMKHRMLNLLFAVVAALMAGGRAEARELVLAKNGTARYSIENRAADDAAAEYASSQLALYLERISGAEFDTGSAAKHVIALCYNDTLAAEEYAVDCRNGDLELSGGSPRALLYAVYSFLEELGCRWLAPDYDFYNGTGEFVPACTVLRYDFSGRAVRSPKLKYRKLYVEEGHSHTVDNLRLMIDWMAKMQYNVLVHPINYQGRDRVMWDKVREELTPELRRRGIMIEVGGHGYQNFISATMEHGRLFEEHPEWFGMAAGRRTDRMERVFCTSNAEAVDYLVGNLMDYLGAHPEIDIFDFWPPDGARWCECDRCAGIGDPSDQHARIVSIVAERMARELPDMKIECLGYSLYKDVSERYDLDRKVLVDFCPIGQSFEDQIYDPQNSTNSGYVASLKGWIERFKGDISIYSYYRKYAWHSLPVLLPHYMQNDLKWYLEQGLRGISVYCEPGDWFEYETNLYTLGKLAQNPDADVDTLLGDFARCRYGDSAAVALRAYDAIERIARRGCSIPGTRLKTAEIYDGYLVEIAAVLAAVEAEKDSNAAHRAMLDNLTVSLQFLQKDLEIQRARAAGASPDEIRAMTDRLIEWSRNYPDRGLFLPSKLKKKLFYKQYGVLPAVS